MDLTIAHVLETEKHSILGISRLVVVGQPMLGRIVGWVESHSDKGSFEEQGTIKQTAGLHGFFVIVHACPIQRLATIT